MQQIIGAYFYHSNMQATRITKVIPRKEMMEEHSSYHQSISGDEAERRLRERGRHCYLTRYSTNHKKYVLTVFEPQMTSDVIKHFIIAIDENRRYRIEGEDFDFESIQDLLHHYEDSRIDPALKVIGRNYTEDDYKEFEQNRQRQARVRNRPNEGNRVHRAAENRHQQDNREPNGVNGAIHHQQAARNDGQQAQRDPQQVRDMQQGGNMHRQQQQQQQHRGNRQQRREERSWCPLL